jgi:hypothetical protein
MAVLTEAERELIWEEMVSKNREGEVDSLTREELRAAIDATDDWIVANQASFNAALPIPARTVLTARQKALMFSFVVRRRWLVNA